MGAFHEGGTPRVREMLPAFEKTWGRRGSSVTPEDGRGGEKNRTMPVPMAEKRGERAKKLSKCNSVTGRSGGGEGLKNRRAESIAKWREGVFLCSFGFVR